MIIIRLIIFFNYQRHKVNMLQLQLYQQETIKNYQNFLVKDLKDQFIEINIKQKVRIKI